MEKLYTKQDYINACKQANTEGKIVALVQKNIEYDVEVLEWNKKLVEVELYDEETGEPTGETKTVEVDDLENPIMVQEEIVNPETGAKELVTVQKHHTESRVKTVEVIELVEDEGKLEREFFKTSLGYVRRKVAMAKDEIRDFLFDIKPTLKVGVPMITYNLDGTQNRDVAVTEEFLKECDSQVYFDFYGSYPNVEGFYGE